MEKDQATTVSVVLGERIDPNNVPSTAEIIGYAKWLGMDLEKDEDLMWICKVAEVKCSITIVNTITAIVTFRRA